MNIKLYFTDIFLSSASFILIHIWISLKSSTQNSSTAEYKQEQIKITLMKCVGRHFRNEYKMVDDRSNKIHDVFIWLKCILDQICIYIYISMVVIKADTKLL